MTFTLGARAQLALDTIWQRSLPQVPTFCLYLMEHAHIERIAGVEAGAYRRDPVNVYLQCMRRAGVCMIDQFIPDNPLTMGDRGFEGAERGATTGAEIVVRDGITLDSPEAVVQHLEMYAFPALERRIRAFDEDKVVAALIEQMMDRQALFGPDMLSVPYGLVGFPTLAYSEYGYGPYFGAYGLYPEAIERHFVLQADLAVLQNRAAARVIREGKLPPMHRLDHDMADSRGTLVSLSSLERLWFPHFVRAIQPLLSAGVRLLWHCDGNLMQMIPRLIEAGVSGLQGFQYEDGMDYPRLCAMRDREGRKLIIIGGVSVTRTLPLGTPAAVKREIDWLVEYGPQQGLFLGPSSSITPGVPWENIHTLLEGVAYYRERGRSGQP